MSILWHLVGTLSRMGTQEWCIEVIARFFPHLVTPLTFVSPALSRVAGEIWNDWHSVQSFAQAIPKMPDYSPPSDFLAVQLMGSFVWRRFMADPDAVDWAVRARIQRAYHMRVLAAISGEMSVDQI
jgi:hypothetical protein